MAFGPTTVAADLLAGVRNLVHHFLTRTTSEDDSPLFSVLNMVKNFKMWETKDLYLDRACLSGWLVSDHLP